MSIDRAELLRLRDRIKVIVFDLDGTLLNDEKIIPQENVDIIKQLQKAGIAFVIASGRHAHEVFSLLDSCGIKGIKYVICRDGQHIYDENKRRIKSFQYLNAKDIARLFTFSNCSNIFFSNEEKDYLIFRTIRQQIKHIIKHNLDLKTNHLHTLSLLAARICRLRVGKAIFFNNNDVDLNMLSFYFTVHTMASGGYDVFPLGVNKYQALKSLMERIGINQDELLYFGDDDNDRECFINLANVIVMGNAAEDLKQFSILNNIPSNNESGVSIVLHDIFHINETENR